MINVIGVKFRTGSRVYYFDPNGFDIKLGDSVIVETARGDEFGEVVSEPHEVEENRVVLPLKPVLRLASEQDKRDRELYRSKEKEAFAICQDMIAQHELDMKLVDAEYSYNGSKVVFCFTANERVDFRNLVKDLAYKFRTRIELRQIGVRDEANMLGGLGPCGRTVCCKQFLDEFRPVSIKMAKEQNLSLSPTKISGLCGRLMCCLQYEQSGYESMRKLMPPIGLQVITADGIGIVVENNVITEKTKVKLTTPDGDIDVRSYHYTHIAPSDQPLPAAALQQEKKPEEAVTMEQQFMNRRRNTRERPAPKAEENESGKPEAPTPKQGNRPRTGKKPQDTNVSDTAEQSAAKPQRQQRPKGPRPEGGRQKPKIEGKPLQQRPAQDKAQGNVKPTASAESEARPATGEKAAAMSRGNQRRRRPAPKPQPKE
ncbi:MAG TPA: regulatory iron-sulfur-containing complex subunit RicT [Clostridia bacterium]|nr:regulatory iron-sulfur-containing complex subunit RicT [Clostridia bacterium]